MGEVSVRGIDGIGEVRPGDDVARHIDVALEPGSLRDGDIVVVTHKIVSKAEGRIVVLDPDDPDAHHRRLVEEESAAILRRRGSLTIARSRHGFVCANAGVDRSNTRAGTAVLLPIDPDRSARRIRSRLLRSHPVRLAVVISDTFGRPWRRGLTDVAIGVAGMHPITDLRGTVDGDGNVLEVTEVAVADEAAAAADLVMGKASRIPAAIVRGVEWVDGDGSIAATIRPASEDLFR